MALSLVTAPALEPLTAAEAALQIRLDSGNQEPAPTTAPTVALAGLGAGNVNSGAHRYGVSFVTADGETEPSSLSDAVTTTALNGQVSLTAIATGGAAVTSRKVWRTVAGGSTLFLLATLANNTATIYADNIADASLGAAAPSTNTTSDPELLVWISAARERGELATQRAFITQTWDLVLDEFPPAGYIELPKAPLQTVSYVHYVDTQGNTQTLTPTTQYLVQAPAGERAARGRIALPFATVWPITLRQMGAVTVRFVCGYGTSRSNVPALLRAAMKMDLGTLYENREGVMVSAGLTGIELPMGVRPIYWAYKSHATQRLRGGYAA